MGQEGVRWQRPPEVGQGSAASEEGIELEGHGASGWQNHSGPHLVRQGEGAPQSLSDAVSLLHDREHLARVMFEAAGIPVCAVQGSPTEVGTSRGTTEKSFELQKRK